MYAVHGSAYDASTRAIHVFAGKPRMLGVTFAHVLPASCVTCTRPSSVPTHTTPAFTGDSAIVRMVVWNSAAVLSVTISPPDDSCFVVSFVVRSGLITSQLWP